VTLNRSSAISEVKGNREEEEFRDEDDEDLFPPPDDDSSDSIVFGDSGGDVHACEFVSLTWKMRVGDIVYIPRQIHQILDTVFLTIQIVMECLYPTLTMLLALT